MRSADPSVKKISAPRAQSIARFLDRA